NKQPLLYYRDYGIRKLSGLINPKVVNITDLPRKSVLHYCTFDQENVDIDVSLPLLNTAGASRIMVDYPEVLLSEVGNPRKVAFQLNPPLREFHRVNKKYKRLKNAAVLNQNEKILTVLNYSYLYKTYKYVENKWLDYNQWLNIARTMMKGINTSCNEGTFNQFFVFHVPKDIPSRTILNQASNGLNATTLSIFDTVGERMALELW
ncbi:hypothetical protein ACPF8X_43810, partial [Streptomyces sp. G35A]